MRKRSDATGGTPLTTPPAHGNGGMVLLGRISDAQGLSGEVRIATFTETPENIAAYGPLTAGDGRQFRIASLRPLKGASVVAHLEGIADRTAAEALGGIELYVARENLPEPDDGEWYITDLIGLKAVSPAGLEIGKVVAVPNFGAGDLVEIRPDGGQRTLLVPFTVAAVPDVDLQAGVVVVALPEEIDAGEPEELHE